MKPIENLFPSLPIALAVILASPLSRAGPIPLAEYDCVWIVKVRYDETIQSGKPLRGNMEVPEVVKKSVILTHRHMPAAGDRYLVMFAIPRGLHFGCQLAPIRDGKVTLPGMGEVEIEALKKAMAPAKPEP